MECIRVSAGGYKFAHGTAGVAGASQKPDIPQFFNSLDLMVRLELDSLWLYVALQCFCTHVFLLMTPPFQPRMRAQGLQNNVLLLTEERCFAAAVSSTRRGVEVAPRHRFRTELRAQRELHEGTMLHVRDPCGAGSGHEHSPGPQTPAASAETAFIQHPQLRGSEIRSQGSVLPRKRGQFATETGGQ